MTKNMGMGEEREFQSLPHVAHSKTTIFDVQHYMRFCVAAAQNKGNLGGDVDPFANLKSSWARIASSLLVSIKAPREALLNSSGST